MLLYFPHIPKTGGQTLLQGFFRTFGFKKCLKVWNTAYGADVMPKAFAELPEEAIRGASAVVGHLPFSDFLANKYARREFEARNVVVITSVRNPIDRIISLYNYQRFSDKHPCHEKVRNTSLVMYAANQPANFQFGFLQFAPDAGLDDLFNSIRIYPIESSVKHFMDFFEKNFGAKLGNLAIKNKSVDWANDKGDVLSIDDLPSEVVHRLLQKHYIDHDLYRRALANLGPA